MSYVKPTVENLQKQISAKQDQLIFDLESVVNFNWEKCEIEKQNTFANYIGVLMSEYNDVIQLYERVTTMITDNQLFDLVEKQDELGKDNNKIKKLMSYYI